MAAEPIYCIYHHKFRPIELSDTLYVPHFFEVCLSEVYKATMTSVGVGEPLGQCRSRTFVLEFGAQHHIGLLAAWCGGSPVYCIV